MRIAGLRRGCGTARGLLVVAGALVGLACTLSGAGQGAGGDPPDPGDATYRIEGEPVHLRHGLAEVQAAPGSATRTRTRIFGDPSYGDLDGDGIDDAAVVLVQDPGGSGTFYYATAALRTSGGYRGTNGVLLGDRVAPQGIVVRNGVVWVHYTDRAPEEPLAAAPTVAVTKVLVLQGDELRTVPVAGPEAGVREGWLTVGHEVRSFEPCGEERALWIAGDSPVVAELTAAYRHALPGAEPYAPLFAVVVGRYGPSPPDGFGADYDGSFLATRLVRVWPRGNCRSEYLVLEAPAAGQSIRSPLTVRGRARGGWFFEGDFPMELRDSRGETIARHYATAQGEWMTGGFVPFEGRLEFRAAAQPQRGTLVLRRNNPAAPAAPDDAVEIPILLRGEGGPGG